MLLLTMALILPVFQAFAMPASGLTVTINNDGSVAVFPASPAANHFFWWTLIPGGTDISGITEGMPIGGAEAELGGIDFFAFPANFSNLTDADNGRRLIIIEICDDAVSGGYITRMGISDVINISSETSALTGITVNNFSMTVGTHNLTNAQVNPVPAGEALTETVTWSIVSDGNAPCPHAPNCQDACNCDNGMLGPVVSLSGTILTAHRAGTATIRATHGTFTANATVTVTAGGGTGSGNIGGGTGAATGTGAPSAPTVTNVTTTNEIADFAGGSVTFNLNLAGHTVEGVRLGNRELAEGTDFVIEGSRLTFNQAFLTTLRPGTHSFSVQTSGGPGLLLRIIIAEVEAAAQQEDAPQQEAAPPPERPVEVQIMRPTHAAGTVVSGNTSINTLIIDGEHHEFPAVNFGGFNFLKLRDIAMLLNGTEASFGIGFNSTANTITITSGMAYSPVGGELDPLVGITQNAVASQQTLIVDGRTVDVVAFNIGGFNYFRLRDIAVLIGFGVEFNDATGEITLLLGSTAIADEEDE